MVFIVTKVRSFFPLNFFILQIPYVKRHGNGDKEEGPGP